MPFGLVAVLVTQFLSALADNAILFAAIALLKSQQAPSWNIPLLQEFFVIAFLLTAPFVGPIAEAYPKNRVLMGGTFLKIAGALWLLAGGSPFLCYALVGLGAAVYSPAKYGILPELTSSKDLVKANGWLEGSTIVAILLGTLLGGKLADGHLSLLVPGLCGVYALAAMGTLLVPKVLPANPLPLTLSNTLGTFVPAVRTMWRNPDIRFSLTGTGLFWGMASVMRFLLIAWVPYALLIQDNAMVGYLNAATALGIIVGAAVAGRWVRLETVNRVLPAGVLLGLAVIGLAFTQHVPLTIAVLVLVGALGGFYVVPLNALLQERGLEQVGAGRAIAVQNMFENAGMLVMMGAYLLMEKQGISPVHSGAFMGIGLTAAMLWIAQSRRRAMSQRAPAGC